MLYCYILLYYIIICIWCMWHIYIFMYISIHLCMQLCILSIFFSCLVAYVFQYFYISIFLYSYLSLSLSPSSHLDNYFRFMHMRICWRMSSVVVCVCDSLVPKCLQPRPFHAAHFCTDCRWKALRFPGSALPTILQQGHCDIPTQNHGYESWKAKWRCMALQRNVVGFPRVSHHDAPGDYFMLCACASCLASCFVKPSAA